MNPLDDRVTIPLPLQLPAIMRASAHGRSTVVSESSTRLDSTPSLSAFFDALFALLNNKAIPYCVLKRCETAPDDGIEILELAVDRAHRKELPTLFLDLPRDRYRPVQCIGTDLGAEQFHFAVFSGFRPHLLRVDVLYPSSNVLLSEIQNEIFVRRQWQDTFWMSAPVDEFCYLLAKSSQTETATNQDAERLKLLAESLGSAAAERVADMFGLRARTEVVAACSTGDLDIILNTLRYVTQHADPAHKNVHSTVAVLRRGWQLLHNWFLANGLLITILGPDGAGKTTISTKIFDLLGPAFGPRRLLTWRPEVLPRLSQGSSPLDLPHSKPLYGRLQSLARIFAIFLDYWIGHFILIKPLLSRSALIVYDRDIHDVLVDSRRYRYGGPRWVLPWLTSALPQTESLFLILVAAPEVILKRKQEVAPEEVHRQLAAYRTLAAKLPDACLIRTDRDSEATTSAVMQSIVNHLGQRYERRYVPKKIGDALRGKTKRVHTLATTLTAVAVYFCSHRRSWLQKSSLAILDQAFISGSNFLLAILLARWMSAEQYGAYALSFALFVLFSFIQQGLFLEPMSVFGPSIYRTSQRAYLGTLIWLQGALAGGALAFVVFALTTFLRNQTGELQMALLGMLLSAPCVLLYWFSRRAFYLQLRPGGAVGGAILYCVLLSMGIWLLVHTDLLSPFTAFLAMGVAALLTSFRQLVQLRPVLWQKQTSDLWDLSRRHWNYGRWAILSSLFIWIPWSVYYPLVARFSGLAEVANLRALLNLALPVTQAISALTLLFLPHVSDVGGQESWAGARSLALRITALFALGSVLYWLPVCLFRASLIKFLYAGHYSQISPLIPWIGLSSVLSGAALGPTIAFRAMRSPSIVTFYYFIASAVTLVIGIPGTRLFGLPGVVTCLLLSNFVAVVLGWTMLSREAGAGVESRRVAQEAVP